MLPRLTAAVTVAITLLGAASSMTIAQETDSTCFMRTASGRVIDMSGLCNPNKPTTTPATPRLNSPSPTLNSPSPTPTSTLVNKSQCRALRNAIKQADKSLEKSNQNTTKFVQAALRQAKAIEKLSIQDAAIKELQLGAAEFYKGLARFAQLAEEVGPAPTQNQAFGVSAYIGNLMLTYQYIDDSLTKYCGG